MSPETSNTKNFTDEERAAMQDRAAEAKRARGKASAADDAAACAEKIAEMGPADRKLAQKVHDIVTETAPELAAKTWYGMPAYAKAGKVVVFFKPGEKFKSRYCTLGFEDAAQVDDGTFWATSYAITAIGAAEEKVIADLVRKAVG